MPSVTFTEKPTESSRQSRSFQTFPAGILSRSGYIATLHVQLVFSPDGPNVARTSWACYGVPFPSRLHSLSQPARAGPVVGVYLVAIRSRALADGELDLRL